MSAKTHRGFTLIELLVVIAIIGILSSVVIASLNSARTKGRDTRRVADLKQLQLALELAYDANGSYPDATSFGDGSALVTPGYLAAMPADPAGGSAAYGYVQTASGQGYVLGAILEEAEASVLNGDYDVDQVININGGATNCNANAGTPGTGEVVYCISI